MVRAWHGRGMASVNQTRPHCVNQIGKTHSKTLAARHGRGTAWARHGMCESAFRVLLVVLMEIQVLRCGAVLTGQSLSKDRNVDNCLPVYTASHAVECRAR
jgi:hypothetical protein